MELTEISTRELRCWHLAEEEKTCSFLLGENPSKLKKWHFLRVEGAPATLDPCLNRGCVPGMVRTVCRGYSRWTSASLLWRVVWIICEGDICVHVMQGCLGVFRLCNISSLLADSVLHSRDFWG